MVLDNILKIKSLISSVCAQAGRKPEEITIVAVSKNRSVEQIRGAVSAGILNIGENRVQEAIKKHYELSRMQLCKEVMLRDPEVTQKHTLHSGRVTDYGLRIKWHLVGHLQTNKVKDALKIFDLIHSVDGLRLAQEIDKQAAKINKIQDILVEVNTSSEATKFGVKPDEVVGVIKEIARLKNINLKGLMTIAPLVDNPEKTRPYFKLLPEIMRKVNELQITDCGLRILSMGMTDDFEAAIEEGSNMLRLGRAIFE